jgi:nitric oxide reductase subunit B
VFYIIKNESPEMLEKQKPFIGKGIIITNIALLLFWISLLGSGLVKISSKLNNEAFATLMQKSKPWFQVFAYSGTVVLIGFLILIYLAILLLSGRKPNTMKL